LSLKVFDLFQNPSFFDHFKRRSENNLFTSSQKSLEVSVI
jgi:hypothetical protein